MSEQKVYMETKAGGVAFIYLNQPKKKNAISPDMMDLLAALLVQAEQDEAVRAIVLRGEGEVFSSGGDLSAGGPEGVTLESSRKMLRRYIAAVRAIRKCPKPVVAMVDGYAVGGAMSLALACDLIYVSDRALFIPNFCSIGIIPEMGAMWFLPQLIGEHKAKEMLFLGGRLTGQQAYGMNLVNHVYPAEELEKETMAAAEALAAQPALSLAITKGIMNSALDEGLDSVMEAESIGSPFCTQSEEYKAIAAKFAKK